MEGKATLTLTEARTGRVVKQVTEHNLVTDAVKRILDPPLYTLPYNFSYKNFLSQVMPIWKLFSGIMLLGNTLDESRDNVVMSKDCIPVATAGSPYSGTHDHRGTLNENETYATANGYHFTWDFATDKANGVIKSVALTSQYFGDSAFSNMGNPGKLFADPSNISYIYDYTMQYLHARGQYIGTFQDRTHLYITYEGNTVTFLKYVSNDPKNVRINDSNDLSGWHEAVSSVSVELPIDLYYFMKTYLDPENRVLYFFSKLYTEDGNQMIDYAGVDLTEFKVVTSGTQNVNPCRTAYAAAVRDGRFYLMTQYNITVFTLGGEVLKTYEQTCRTNSWFSTWEGMLVGTVDTRVTAVFPADEKMYLFYNPGDYIPTYSCDIKPPYYAMYFHEWGNTEASKTSRNPYLGLAMNYLATINNLSEPLEKTSEHTLKITYDITNS